MFKATLITVSVLTFSHMSLAQNPAGPRGGNEPPLTTQGKPTPKATPVLPETLPPAKNGTLEVAPSGSPVAPNEEAPATIKESHKNGPHRFGIFTALTIPHVLNYGLDYKHSSQAWGLSLAGGSFKYDSSEINVKISNYEIVGRYFPWNGSFFAGLGFGHHEIDADTTETIQGQSVTVKANIAADYATPQVGWHWSTDWGLTWGFELGVMASMGSKAKIEDGTTNPAVLNDPEYIKNKKDAEDFAKAIGDSSVPYLTLLRLGYQF